MRIESLRLQNLNSLAGEWRVDFQDPAYATGGIFAITGATGAGKTTLLDALCLALFGRTPRLKTISTATNEIMTHGTGECVAEAVFSTAKGRFRCHWSQRRARRKADGRLQPPRHEIVDAGSGTVLETKLRQVALRVTAVTGLDFDRFSRSILLAQGGFAAFLQAGPDERAPILEEITGTGIYSDISMGVHERLRRESTTLDKLTAQLNGLDLPDADDEARLESERAALADRLKKKHTERLRLTQALTWRQNLATLKAELIELAQEAEAQKERQAAAQEDMARLTLGEKAQPLAAGHDRLNEIRRQIAENRANQETLTAQRNQLAAEEEAARERAAKAQAHLAENRRIQSDSAGTLKAVRALDVQREAAARQVREQEALCTKHRKAVDQAKAVEAVAHRTLDESRAALEKAQTYLHNHPADAALITAMTGIRRQYLNFEHKRTALAVHDTRLNEAGQAATAAKKKAAQARETADALRQIQARWRAQLTSAEERHKAILPGRNLADQRRHCEQLREQLHLFERAHELTVRRERIEKEKKTLQADQKKWASEARAAAADETACRQEKALREQAVADKSEALNLQRRVADLEAERRHLREGQPCPLCGAQEHPWAIETPPPPDAAQEALTKAQNSLADTEQRLQKWIAKASRISSKVSAVAENLADAARREQEIRADLAAISLPDWAGPEAPSGTDLAASIAAQRETLAASRDILATAEAVDKEMAQHRAELEKATTQLATGEGELQKAGFLAEAADHELKRLATEGDRVKKEYENASRELLEELVTYGITKLPETNASALLEDLEERLRCYLEAQQAADKWRQTAAEQTHEAALKAQAVDQAAAQLNHTLVQLEALKKQCRNLDQERGVLFGDRDPDLEEARLAEQLARAEKKKEAADKAVVACQQAETAAQTRSQTLSEQLVVLESHLAAKSSDFDTAISAAGFRDEIDFSNARLSAAEMDDLSNRKKKLEQAAAALTARTKDRETALAKVRAENLTPKSSGTLKGEIEVLDAERDSLQARAGALAEQLNRIAKTRASHAEILALHDAQAAVCGRWERLHDLIGSADGKKFRVFAQGLTFEQVVAYANQELQKMSARYIMVRDPKRPLALLMADDYQGGVLRATDNLSGGESFLVSLALALGLARMASHNVRLDSLFLDEGFGTLDEETLDIALDTLGGLHREGKLIGIISHVATLKERIPVQIKVISGTNGRSRLEGPGCQRGAGLD